MRIFKVASYTIATLLVLAGVNRKSNAQPYGDYSIRVVVENSGQTFSHETVVFFTNNCWGSGNTPTFGHDQVCDAYALPPLSGQPMVYTSVTAAPFPPLGNANEYSFNSAPPLVADWSVPLGFDAGTGVTDVFTFTVDWLYTIPANIGVELEDLQVGATQDLLNNNSYTFTGSHSDAEARFMIHFSILGGGNCETPESPVASNISWNQFDVAWTCTNCSGGEAFIIEYGPEGFTPGNGSTAGTGGTVISPATSPATISGLSEETAYDIYVRSECSGPSFSNNAGPGTVLTSSEPCPMPQSVGVSAIASTTADVSWSCPDCSGGEFFILEYGPTGFTPGTDLNAGGGTVIQGAISVQQLTGLIPGTAYDVYVRTRCDGTDFSDNSSIQSFSTINNCPVPDPPTVSNVTGSSAVVEWTCGSCSGGEGFILQYGPFNFPNNGSPSDFINPASSPQSLTGLTPGIQYSVWVQSQCGGGVTSNFTPLVHFDNSVTCSAGFSVGSSGTCVGSDVSFTDNSTGATTWLWDFGDGNTSTMQNPVHVYQNTGTFDVSLTITDGGTCTDDTTFNSAVTVHPPVAQFTLNPSVGCAIPHTVFFTDQSTLPDTWFWDFGDGNTSTVQNPVHNYTTTGTFDVLLTVADTIFGCSDTASATVMVDIPTADFTGAPLFGCAPLTTTFNDGSTSSGLSTIVSWAWDFGDGNTSTDQNPSHSYDIPGVYNISLTVTTSTGCSDTRTRPAYVQVIGPNVDFGPDPVITGCVPLNVSFTDSTVFSAPITSWTWDFGDGNTSPLQNPTHTYTTSGSFDVSLTVTDDNGCSQTVLHAGNVEPGASVVSISCPGDEIVTTCTFTVPDYTGSVTVTDPCDPSPTVTQSIAAGTEVNQNTTVWLYAENASGDVDSCDVQISFTGSNLSAGCQPTTVSLDASGNATIDFDATANADQGNANSNGSTAGTNFYQSFQPGQNGIINQIDLNIASISTPASITLSIYDGIGTGGTLLHSQPVPNIPGAVSIPITGIIPLTMGSNYTFELDVTGGGNIALLRDSGDPYGNGDSQIPGTDLLFETFMLILPNVESGSTSCQGIASVALSQSSFTCADLGTMNVDMTLTDHVGNTSMCTAAVTVEDNLAPEAVCQPFTVSLDASGNGTITTANVDGGSSDNCGIASMTVSPSSFTCSDIGTTTVTLTVTDGAGLIDTCTATITVEDNNPPTAVCSNLTVYLDGAGNASITAGDVDGGSSVVCGSITSLTLDQSSFNCNDLGTNSVVLAATGSNGMTDVCTATVTVIDSITPTIVCPGDTVLCATDMNGIEFTYSTPAGSDNCVANVSQIDVTGLSSGSVFPPGTTTLVYEVSDNDGNSATCSFDVTVLPAPVTSFSNTAGCLGETIFFTDESTIEAPGTIDSWSWDMGDGSSLIGIVDPTHVYAATGTYTVTLTVVSDDGCVDSHSSTVTVTEVPTADFSASAECLGTATQFTNASTIAPSYTGGLNYEWNFGDGASSTDTDPSHVYGAAGTYTVTLTVTTDDGCEDMMSSSLTVLEQPTALFVFSEACLGDSTIFTNLSVGSGLSYSWDFGDGITSIDSNPSHTYAGAGTYTVTLTATNGNGCSNVNSILVSVLDDPTVGFTFSNTCEESEVIFTNTSDAGTYAWDFGDGNSSILQNPPNTYANAGTYDVTLTVTNGNGCTDQLTQQIEIYDNPEFSLVPTDVLCFGDTTGSIFVSPTIGTAPLDFILDGGAPQISSTFSGLGAGNYTITVIDANGCETSDNVLVGQPAAVLGINLNGLTDILCHGDTTGMISVAGTGGTTPYSFSIDGGLSQGNGQFTGLTSGAHALNITDDNGCMFDTTITLTEPDTLVLMVDSLGHLLCNGDSSGWISLMSTGGVMPFEYSIDGTSFDAPNTFSGLAAGTYTLTVLDANGCTDTANVVLTEPGVLMLSLLGTMDALCNGLANGSITVEASSGTAPYQYSIDGGVNWQASGNFLGIGAGSYNLIVMDSNGCTAEVGATISEPTAITVATATTPILCLGDSSGTIDITATGGTPSYTFSINGGGSYSVASSFSGLPSGNYVVVVQDSLGCTASESVVISQPSSPLFGTALIQEIGCFGDSTGVIEIQATGGTGSYSYSIDGGSNWQVSDTYENLTPGSYAIIIEDVNGCTFVVDAEVEAPAAPLEISEVLLSPPSCPGENDGTITIVATGGTAPYQYSANGGMTFITTNVFSGATAGAYGLVLMDDNGCSTSMNVIVSDPDSIVAVVDSLVIVECEGENYGEIHISATGGTGMLSYQLNGGPPQASGSFTGLSSGIHSVEITDSLGCSVEVLVDATASNPLPDPNFEYVTAGTTVSFNNTSVFGNSFNWNFGDGSGTSTNEDPSYTYSSEGSYDVTLTATNNCGSVDTTITINTNFVGVEDEEVLSDLSLYPNPTSGLFSVSFKLAGHVDLLNMEVFDIRGRVVHSRSARDLAGNQNIAIDLSQASEGLYRLRLSTGEYSQVMKIVVTR